MDWVFSLIPDISLDTANKFYTFGWAASLIGAAITFCGVIFLMWGTRVRDHDFEHNIAILHDRAAASEERSKELDNKNLELAAVLERERAARAKIEAGLASRHVRPEQIEALVTWLKGIKISVTISTYGEAESTTYAAEISNALQLAGQTVVQGSVIMAGGGNITGVHVEEEADARLVNALFVSGLATGKIPRGTKLLPFNVGQGSNTVVVGRKPNPF